MVIGFPITNKSEEEVLHEVVLAMMREDTRPKSNPIIEWMKEENNGRSSLVLLNTGSSQDRDFILRNLKKDKGFTVTKSFPARYKQARAKLNEMGNALK